MKSAIYLLAILALTLCGCSHLCSNNKDMIKVSYIRFKMPNKVASDFGFCSFNNSMPCKSRLAPNQASQLLRKLENHPDVVVVASASTSGPSGKTSISRTVMQYQNPILQKKQTDKNIEEKEVVAASAAVSNEDKNAKYDKDDIIDTGSRFEASVSLKDKQIHILLNPQVISLDKDANMLERYDSNSEIVLKDGETLLFTQSSEPQKVKPSKFSYITLVTAKKIGFCNIDKLIQAQKDSTDSDDNGKDDKVFKDTTKMIELKMSHLAVSTKDALKLGVLGFHKTVFSQDKGCELYEMLQKQPTTIRLSFQAIVSKINTEFLFRNVYECHNPADDIIECGSIIRSLAVLAGSEEKQIVFSLNPVMQLMSGEKVITNTEETTISLESGQIMILAQTPAETNQTYILFVQANYLASVKNNMKKHEKIITGE